MCGSSVPPQWLCGSHRICVLHPGTAARVIHRVLHPLSCFWVCYLLNWGICFSCPAEDSPGCAPGDHGYTSPGHHCKAQHFLTLLAFWFLFHVESSQLTTDHLIFSTQDQRVTGKKKLGWNKVRATGIEFQKTRISKQFVGICGGQKKATQRKSKRGNFPPRDPPSEGHTLLRLSEFTSGWKRCVQGSTGERVKNKQLECGTSKIFRLLSLFLFWQDVT